MSLTLNVCAVCRLPPSPPSLSVHSFTALHSIASSPPSISVFFFFSRPLSVSAVSLLSSLFKVSGFSVGFPIRHTRWCWKQEAGDPDWPALTSGVALSAAHFSFTLLRPLLTSRAFLFPHVSQGFYLLISCFSGIFSVIFFPSLLLCNVLTPLCHPFSISICLFFSSPPAFYIPPSLPLSFTPFLLLLPFLISSAMTSCVFIFPFNSCLCSRARPLTSSSLVSFFLPLFFSTLSTARRVAL